MSIPPPMLVPACPPAADDPEICGLLETIARAAAARWVRLDLVLDGLGTRHRYDLGSPGGPASTVELRQAGHFQASVTVGSAASLSVATGELVTRALRHILEVRRLQHQTTLLGTALDASDGAVLLFDRQGAIMYANAEADRLLARQTEDGLAVRRSKDRGEPLFSLLCAVVEELVAAPGAEPAWRGRLALSDGTALACELRRLAPENEADSAAPAVLAHLNPASGSPDLQVDGFAASCGLSRREAEVLHLLVAGSSVTEVAQRLGISPHTVRDHVKRLYRKTGASSRNELLRFLASATVAPPVSG